MKDKDFDRAEQNDVCENNFIHESVVAEVRTKMPDEEILFNLADLFKMFGDSTRVKIISALLNAEMCVCDIAALLGMTKSAISHQLRSLRQTKLVKFRREGKIVYYSLDDDHVKTIFAQGLLHVGE
ncbi:MAG: metalloregulator ArsR/SmtB family transcription factor [Treponema sp.]|jgi:DNA-binding transcriptional ArsR family regulator|nr:metalloregulator ArsR/SmtB family transcription factor [Treponema sp.]